MFLQAPAGQGRCGEMGWELEGVWHHQTGLQQLPGEREPPKISLGTFQLQGQREGTQNRSAAKPSISGKPCWLGVYSFRTEVIYGCCHKAASG